MELVLQLVCSVSILSLTGGVGTRVSFPGVKRNPSSAAVRDEQELYTSSMQRDRFISLTY
jgi:hypothetical protein